MKALFLVLVLFILFPSTTFTNNLEAISLKPTRKLINFLIPFTKSDHLSPCSNYFNVEEEYYKSLSCSNKKVFSKESYNKTLKDLVIPQCFVITTKSPDVVQTKALNYLNSTVLSNDGIVGFYDEKTKAIYIVENFDAPMIWRHELQHYFLDLVDKDANGSHDHTIWQRCEPKNYQISKEAQAAANKK